jgi:hypothetical protein
MATEHEVNEKAMLAMSLRRRNRTISQIALYLDCKKRYVYTLLARAENLWSLLVDANDSKTRIGENLRLSRKWNGWPWKNSPRPTQTAP